VAPDLESIFSIDATLKMVT